jgi:hypothetical protein
MTVFDHEQAACRCARYEGIVQMTARQLADVQEMEAVDVLVGRYGLGDALLVDVLRQRQLDQDAVDSRIAIQAVDECQDFPFGCVRVQRVLHGVKAAILGRSLLVSYIDLARRIVANEDDGEPGSDAARSHQARRIFGDRFRQLGGFCLAVDEGGVRHEGLIPGCGWLVE